MSEIGPEADTAAHNLMGFDPSKSIEPFPMLRAEIVLVNDEVGPAMPVVHPMCR